MIRVALKGLAGRKLRAALTAIAIVLGVAMVSGTYILTDTIKAGFDTIFQVSYQNTDVVITGKTAFGPSNQQQRHRRRQLPGDRPHAGQGASGRGRRGWLRQ